MTREEAIERLELCQNVCNDCLTCASHDEALDMAIAALREQDSNANQHVSNTYNALGGWISAEERLPDQNKFLGISRFSNKIHLYEKQERYKDWVVSGLYIPKGIRYWMPLPEPPKEEV